jgi:hypothetical protein
MQDAITREKYSGRYVYEYSPNKLTISPKHCMIRPIKNWTFNMNTSLLFFKSMLMPCAREFCPGKYRFGRGFDH